MDYSAADEVHISVPSIEGMSNVIRIATTAVANISGLNIDQADDLNTALEELFRLLASETDMEGSLFKLNYTIHGDRLEVVNVGSPVEIYDDSKKVCRYSRFIIENVVDQLGESPNAVSGFDIQLIVNCRVK